MIVVNVHNLPRSCACGRTNGPEEQQAIKGYKAQSEQFLCGQKASEDSFLEKGTVETH